MENTLPYHPQDIARFREACRALTDFVDKNAGKASYSDLVKAVNSRNDALPCPTPEERLEYLKNFKPVVHYVKKKYLNKVVDMLEKKTSKKKPSTKDVGVTLARLGRLAADQSSYSSTSYSYIVCEIRKCILVGDWKTMNKLLLALLDAPAHYRPCIRSLAEICLKNDPIAVERNLHETYLSGLKLNAGGIAPVEPFANDI